ncbi:hypothetical protein TIFTF001_039457 [Ficus carica]|uniref:Uncharacterized protein n=1 Tax=Ficus carica TaxID=3494 RepID=A0AA88JDW8_FICCA|nr:hypothetical protein TIFTF001_039457 [Ficus carica]
MEAQIRLFSDKVRGQEATNGCDRSPAAARRRNTPFSGRANRVDVPGNGILSSPTT